jgi:hypothetical protein
MFFLPCLRMRAYGITFSDYRQTDRQTDRQTHVQPNSLPRTYFTQQLKNSSVGHSFQLLEIRLHKKYTVVFVCELLN